MYSQEIAIPRTPQAQYNYGREVGRRYIAARSVCSLTDSDAACDAFDGENHWQRLGFSFELERSPFATHQIAEALAGEKSCRAIGRGGLADMAIAETIR